MERHENTFGFKPFWSLEKGLFISAITDNTPAHQSDLEIGDAIVSINSEDTSGFDKEDFCNMLRQIAGDGDSFYTQKTLDLVVKKSGGEIKKISTLNSAIAANRNRERVFEWLAGLFMEATENLVDRLAARVIDLPTGQFLGDRINVFHIAFSSCRNDAITD